MMKDTAQRYLKEFGKSLKFDFQQSANLYLLPFRTLAGLYREALQQVQHRPPTADLKIYRAIVPAAQDQVETAHRANFAFELGLRLGSIKNISPLEGSYIPADSVLVTFQTQREAIDWARNRGHPPLMASSAIRPSPQSMNRRTIA